MKKEISYKLVALMFGVLVIFFAIAFYAMGFAEPTVNPPGGNVSLPLNTGNVGQSKEGGLILNTGGATNGLIIQNGRVGIKTSNPTEELEVNGDIKASGTICDSNGCIGGGGSIVCEKVRGSNLGAEDDSEKPTEAIDIPFQCRGGKPCYLILKSMQNNVITDSVGYLYHQEMGYAVTPWSVSGVNQNKSGYKNGDSLNTVVANTNNIFLRDDQNGIETSPDQWTYNDASLNYQGILVVCHF